MTQISGELSSSLQKAKNAFENKLYAIAIVEYQSALFQMQTILSIPTLSIPTKDRKLMEMRYDKTMLVLAETYSRLIIQLILEKKFLEATRQANIAINHLLNLDRKYLLNEKFIAYLLEFYHHLANAHQLLKEPTAAIKVLLKASEYYLRFKQDTQNNEVSIDAQHFIILLNLFNCYLLVNEKKKAEELLNNIPFQTYITFANKYSKEEMILTWISYINLLFSNNKVLEGIKGYNAFLSWLKTSKLDEEFPDLFCTSCLLGANCYLQPNNFKPELALQFIAAASNQLLKLSDERKKIIEAEIELLSLIVAHHLLDDENAEKMYVLFQQRYSNASDKTPLQALLVKLLPFFPAKSENSLLKAQLLNLKIMCHASPNATQSEPSMLKRNFQRMSLTALPHDLAEDFDSSYDNSGESKGYLNQHKIMKKEKSELCSPNKGFEVKMTRSQTYSGLSFR